MVTVVSSVACGGRKGFKLGFICMKTKVLAPPRAVFSHKGVGLNKGCDEHIFLIPEEFGFLKSHMLLVLSELDNLIQRLTCNLIKSYNTKFVN